MTKNQFQDTVFSKSSGMSVLLTTNIVEHYDATYTHSVAWAIHGKEEAKRKWKATHEGTKAASVVAKAVWDGMTGNIVDRVLRDGDEQQTHGIPTGPETSRIISETILSAIDNEFVKQLQDNRISFVGGRYVDDYELYFENERDAEKVHRDTIAPVSANHKSNDTLTTVEQLRNLKQLLDEKYITQEEYDLKRKKYRSIVCKMILQVLAAQHLVSCSVTLSTHNLDRYSRYGTSRIDLHGVYSSLIR